MNVDFCFILLTQCKLKDGFSMDAASQVSFIEIFQTCCQDSFVVDPDWDQNLTFKTDVIWVSKTETKPFKVESQEPQPWNIYINSGKRFLAFDQLLRCQILIIFMFKMSDIKCNWHDPEGNIRIPFEASELCSSKWPVIDFVLSFIFWGQNFFLYFSAVCIYYRLDTWCWWLRVRVWIWQWSWKEAVNFLCLLL